FELGNCEIEGQVDFSHAVFKRDFRAIQDTFHSAALFRLASFERDADLSSSRFENGGVIFDGAHFSGAFRALQTDYASKGRVMAFFGHVRFDGDVDFSLAHFGFDSSFMYSQFGGQAMFVGAIFAGSADFEHAHFVGYSTFGNLPFNKKFEADFEGDANFTNTLFDSTTVFDGIIFEGKARFFDAKFGSQALFRETTFRSNCEFSMTRFGSDVYFSGAQFLGQSNFTFAHIAGSLVFEAAKSLSASMFRGQAQFGGIQVDGLVTFGGGEEFAPGVVFESKAYFDAAKFAGTSNFQGADFKDEVQFASAWLGADTFFAGTKFEGDVFFDRTQFMGAALFSSKPGLVNSNFAQSARFMRKVSFASAHFSSVTRFSRVQFEGSVDFNGAHFDNDAHFEDSEFLGPTSFRSVTFKAVYLSAVEAGDKQPFQNDLDLLGCTYERIQVDWRGLFRYPNGNSRINPYDRQPYVELEEALRKSGSQDEANEVYLERRRVEHLKLTGMARVQDWAYRLLANYGINLWNEFWICSRALGLGCFCLYKAECSRAFDRRI
ncbi:MAG: pentapeptide repeat-containing protein, partial [Candidatus Acidiferrum sp.]